MQKNGQTLKIMLKIEIDEYASCKTKQCSYWRDCACHSSAGDYRMEDGFTPEVFFETDTNEFFCKTASEPNIRKDTLLPSNYNELGYGYQPIVNPKNESKIL